MKLEASGLHPEFQKRVELLIANILEKHGIKLVIASGLRTFAEQNKLYAQGRTSRGRRVTNAKGGDSFHNYGCAADLCLAEPVMEKGKPTQFPDKHPVWDYIGKEAAIVGLNWGGNWKSLKDRPHVEVPIELKTLKALYKAEGMDGVFARVSAEMVKEIA